MAVKKGELGARAGKDVSASKNKIRSPYNNPSVVSKELRSRGTQSPVK